MSILDRLIGGNEARATTLASPSQWLIEGLTGGTAYSGKSVTGETSMSLVPVFSASSLVASAVGGVPLKVYRASDKTLAPTTRQFKMLHDYPNDEMAADELWELVAHHLLLWGNAFLLKDRDELGIVKQLWPLAPTRMSVGRETRGNRAIRYFQVDNMPRRYYESDILQIRGLSSDGLIGYSVVQLARQQLGNMLAQDEFSGRFWGNGTFMGAALTHPGEMSEPAQKRLKKQMQRKQGVAESNGIWVFEEDMKYQNLGMPLRDAQWLEQTKMSDLRVAQMFGLVPPHRWGEEPSSLTYSNAEMAGTEFVRWTGRKWWTRIEKALGHDSSLFPPSSELYPEFFPADLMRGDTKSRFETYQIARAAGLMTVNEIRAAENLPPVEGGDVIETQAPEPPADPPADPAEEAAARTIIVNVPADETRSVEANEGLARAVSEWVDAVKTQEPPVVHIDNHIEVEERDVVIPAPVVNVNVPPGRAPEVVVNVPQSPPAQVKVDVNPTPVTVDAPITVNVPAAKDKTVRFDRDFNGNIKSAKVEDQ